jgi:hypothetical protein
VNAAVEETLLDTDQQVIDEHAQKDVGLGAMLEDPEQRLVERRIREAHLLRMKTLEDFNFSQCLKVSALKIHELAHPASYA